MILAGQRLRISKIKLPVIEIEPIEKDLPDRLNTFSMALAVLPPSRLEALSTTLAVVPPSQSLKDVSDRKDPNLLVHAGWHVVCDTFISLHGEYPSGENLLKRVSELGAQNVEFINIYRGVHEQSIVGGGRRKVPIDYAKQYLSRAFSLAERINPEAGREHGPRVRRLLQRLDPNSRDVTPSRGGWL